jgi:hypothetical protein
MAVFPNYQCTQFCYWLQNFSWLRLSGPQDALVTIVYNAGLNQTSVTDQQWLNFNQFTAWRNQYYIVWRDYSNYLLPDTSTWLSFLPTTPPFWYQIEINKLISDLQGANIWNLLDRFFVLAGPNSSTSLYSIKNTSATPATLVNSPTFTPYRGFTGNGSNMSINTQWNISTNSVNYTLNNASIGAYAITSGLAAGAGGLMGGYLGSDFIRLNDRFSGDLARAGLNNATAYASGANSFSQGFFSGTRTASNLQTVYKNGISLGTNSAVSTALPNSNMFILSGGNLAYSSNTVAIAFMGSGSINQLTLYNIIQTFATRIGFNV